MNRFPPLFALTALLTLTTAPLPASADDDAVLPPPTEVQDTEQARETIEPGTDETNLNKELSAPEDLPDGAEVRSYIRENDRATITEYSIKGRVYMIKVQPVGNMPPYYLYDRNGDGTLEQRLPGGYKRPSPPMWIIKKF